jgi:hypothetical protein
MRETHPIDELFRERLQHASAMPPAHIAEAVLGTVRTKRRAAFWRRSAVAFLFLLLLVGGGVTWNAMRTDDELVSTHPKAERSASGSENAAIDKTKPTTIQAMGPEDATVAKQIGDPAGSFGTSGSSGGDSEKTSADAQPATNTSARAAEDGGAEQSAPREHAGLTRRTDQPAPPQALLPAESAAPVVARDSLAIERMAALLLDRSVRHAPESAALQPSPVVPSGDWWIAPSVGLVSSRYSWSGGADELATALDRSRGWSNDFAVGLFGGRAWRSGLVVSGGIEWQRTEQLFRSTESVTSMESTAVDMVTLNTQVIAADTTWAVVEHVLTAEGTDRRSVLRIPLELAWHQGVRRWFGGPRVGFAGGFTRVRSAASLVWNEEDGRIRSGTLDAEAQRQRYPFAVLGVVGVDLGFLVNERISILASPSYSLPLLDLGRASETHAAAEHVGLRVLLRHTF